jgi:hypothetical protein
MSKKKAQKGISLLIMLLLVMVSPTIVLSSDKIVGLANAQSANQTSSGSFPLQLVVEGDQDLDHRNFRLNRLAL